MKRRIQRLNNWQSLLGRAQARGLSQFQARQRIKEQAGCCAICQRDFPENQLMVDHNHRTKKVRGFLCTQCNSGLGFFKDNPYLLGRAVDYLEFYGN